MAESKRTYSGSKARNKVFISYASKDIEWVDRIASELEMRGHEVLYDRPAISPGESFRDCMQKLLAECDWLLAVVPDTDVSNAHVFFDLGSAIVMKKKLILLTDERVDISEIPMDLKDRLNFPMKTPDETMLHLMSVFRSN